MLGVSMRRSCPDQTATEASRQAYVNAALADPRPASPIKPAVVATAKVVDRRIAGFMRGGH